ncbi:conserved protein [Methanothermobacter thermautotrophicus str. Delta H]|uniref:Phosphomevalonate dehydratase small subunit n=1 Tax=Methanothermobacter thermautotrophicus (strain ATCC 29096 / DSM 1053 / JCM 10044 / NBRC 100330 / Delta H) TaxID=187420 RepID=PMDHS_METTH|nr:DUF126 domain-containing protein [Methanothermobacter thermautotrophicus]O27573.1 RecName: Full=UPF0107 protein MTH_1530 [Methanothermobacter thermautotrophicus str. Delta H]AAB86004.1 conserved protein [Methanothermobacter thermautotrophicus str. Delta H]MDI6818108.1 DUF126 domain-containing protein [Methanothermobacter thermautotrophicus]WBF06029.1 DUF126 domain-containing protein [Methanothermobacter thermautotrophicus]
MEVDCRVISRGKGRGPVLVSTEPLSFLGGVDPGTGRVIDQKHPLHGRSIRGKVLLIPGGKGSTVGSYVIFQMAKNETAPAAIICLNAEPIIATGAIMAGIPMVDRPSEDLLGLLEDSMEVEVDADEGKIRF